MSDNKEKRFTYRILMIYPGNTSIEQNDLLVLINETNRIQTPKHQNSIELILNSGGGDVNTAYKMVKMIRSKCNHLSIVIPLYAKSAATLMSLAANDIIMGPQSDLGPLDAPLEHPLEEGIRISALDGVKPIEYFCDYAIKIAFALASKLRQNEGLGRRESFEMSFDFADNFVSHIVEQLDPLVVNMCYRYLVIAEKFGRELLTTYMLAEAQDKRLPDMVIRQLVWGYPEHGYVIDIDEAKRLQLQVVESDNYAYWNTAWTSFLDYSSRENKTILLIEDRPRLPQEGGHAVEVSEQISTVDNG